MKSTAPDPDARTRPSRETALLDAAISVAAHKGLRGLTHRAVEANAGLPAGSTTYYFPTRAALLRGVLERTLELDEQDAVGEGASAHPSGAERQESGPPDISELAGAWTGALLHLLGPGRERTLARYMLYLESRHDPELAPILDTANRQLAGRLEEFARAAGSAAPRRDARVLVALLDGLLYDRLARPRPYVSKAELHRRVELVLRTVLDS